MPHATKRYTVCGRICSRNRALLYHMRQSHPEHLVPPTASSDAWLDEPQCSVEPADDATSIPAVKSREPASNPAVSDRDPPSTAADTVTNRESSTSVAVEEYDRDPSSASTVAVTEMTQHGASGAGLHKRAANRPRH